MFSKKKIINNINNFCNKYSETINSINKEEQLLFTIYIKKYLFYKCWELKNENLSLAIDRIYRDISKKNKYFLLNKIFFFFFNTILLITKEEKRIAVCYSEGLEYKFKNDLFFINKGNYDEVLYYYELSYGNFINYLKIKILLIIKHKINLKFIPVSFININITNFKKNRDVRNFINLLYTKFKSEKKIYLRFFNKYNTRLFYDSSELSLYTIVKQSTIECLNGKSFSKTRSYPDCTNTEFYYYYFADYFFCWGENEISNYKKKYNYIKNYVISGSLIKNNFDEYLSSLKKKYNKIITIFDTNFNLPNEINNADTYRVNLSFEEYSNIVTTIYNQLELVGHNHLIIFKLKKGFKSKYVHSLINNENKNELLILDDKKHYTVSDLANISNITISFQKSLATSFIESMKYCRNTFFYSINNINRKDINLFNEIYTNKIIYNNLEKMIKVINSILLEDRNLIIKNKQLYYSIHSKEKKTINNLLNNILKKKL